MSSHYDHAASYHVVLPFLRNRGILVGIVHQQDCIVVANTQSGKPELLYKGKHGTVTATVVGPTIGFLWTRVESFRWVQSTKDAGKREKRLPDRETDQPHLERCVKDVRGWFKQRCL